MEYPFKDLQPLDEATARTGYYKDWTHIDADTFHQISELVTFIREKGYGADTREAIAQALERVYHDALISGNANMEVSMARKHFKDLAARLDAGDAAVTASLTDLNNSLKNIDVKWINKNLGKLDQSFMSEEFLQQMVGNTPINAVPADGSIITQKLADKSVTMSKTTFIQESTNLFNADTLNLGQSVVEATGELTPNPQYAVSDYIPIRGDHYIAVKVVGAGGISLYNQDFNHLETHKISSSVGQLVIPTAVTARWARVQTDMTHINQTQLNIGSTMQPYESHYAKLDPLINPLATYMAQNGEEF